MFQALLVLPKYNRLVPSSSQILSKMILSFACPPQQSYPSPTWNMSLSRLLNPFVPHVHPTFYIHSFAIFVSVSLKLPFRTTSLLILCLDLLMAWPIRLQFVLISHSICSSFFLCHNETNICEIYVFPLRF